MLWLPFIQRVAGTVHEVLAPGYAPAMSTPSPPPLVPGDESNSPTYDAQSDTWIEGATDRDGDTQDPISAENEPDPDPDAQRENLPPA